MKEAIEGALATRNPEIVVNTLKQLVDENCLRSVQTRCIKGELEYIQELGTIQTRYTQQNKIYETLQRLLDTDKGFRREWEARQQAHTK